MFHGRLYLGSSSEAWETLSLRDSEPEYRFVVFKQGSLHCLKWALLHRVILCLVFSSCSMYMSVAFFFLGKGWIDHAAPKTRANKGVLAPWNRGASIFFHKIREGLASSEYTIAAKHSFPHFWEAKDREGSSWMRACLQSGAEESMIAHLLRK